MQRAGDLEPRASGPVKLSQQRFLRLPRAYIDDRSHLIVPVELGQQLMAESKSFRAAFAVEASAGQGRLFVNTDTGMIMVNEINTIPGFTSISMYPAMGSERDRLW